MANEPEKPKHTMGVYDRPESADRPAPSPLIWVVVAVVVLVIAYFVVQHFHLLGGAKV